MALASSSAARRVLGSPNARIAAIALSALCVSSCADETRSQVVVVVASDMAVPAELDEVSVRVIGPLLARALDQDFPLSGSRSVTLPFSFGVAPAGDDPNRVVTIEVDAKRAGTVLFTVRRRTQFVEGQARQLVVFLSQRCIDGAATCTEGTTCELGGCVPELVDVQALPRYEPNAPLPDAGAPRESGPMDAGDAGPRDLGPDEGVDDAGDDDVGPIDLGPVDAGPPDAGPRDAGPMDAGPIDAGPMDTGPRDGGPMDAGDAARDMGRVDLGTDAGDAAVADTGPLDAGDAMALDSGSDSGMCEESPCRIVAPQCGCPGTLGCTFRPDGMTECRALGTAGDGDRCDGDSLVCRAGFACISSGAGDPFPRCREVCRATAQCPPSVSCSPITSFTGYGTCQTNCDLADPAGCPDGLGCILGDINVIEGGLARAAICGAVGTAMTGDPCSGNTCAPGLGCVTPPSMPTQCRPWCRRPGSCPAGGGTCSPVSPAPIFGGVEYGVCLPTP